MIEMSELQIVDRPAERKLSRIGPQNRWWDFVWGKLVSLPEGRAIRLLVTILNDNAPKVLYNGEISTGTWQEIRARLNLRAKHAGVATSRIRHQWSNNRVSASLWVDVWLDQEKP